MTDYSYRSSKLLVQFYYFVYKTIIIVSYLRLAKSLVTAKLAGLIPVMDKYFGESSGRITVVVMSIVTTLSVKLLFNFFSHIFILWHNAGVIIYHRYGVNNVVSSC